MKHRVKNKTFKRGQDASQMMTRKLLYNFLKNSTMITTAKRGRVLKMQVDRVLQKSKEQTESNKNFLLRYFPEKTTMRVIFEQVGPAIKDINGGYTKLTRLNQRDSDGAYMVQIDWAHPVVLKWPSKEVVAKTKVAKAAPGKKQVKESKKTEDTSEVAQA